jgi:predicted rRNA methylase YqxC with S4 and FtsJ domains
LRLDEWIVKQGFLLSRSKALRIIRESGVKVNDKTCSKAAYQVKPTDIIVLSESLLSLYNKPIGYQKLTSFVDQAKISFYPNDNALDIGASAGGFSEYILEQEINELLAIEFSIEFKPMLENLQKKYSNFAFIIDDIFHLKEKLPSNHFNLTTIDLTVDPLYLFQHLDQILPLIVSHEHPARVLLTIKLGLSYNFQILLLKFKEKVADLLSDCLRLDVLESLPGKDERALYLEFWSN